jgi:outer membrane protein assembly factor BamB
MTTPVHQPESLRRIIGRRLAAVSAVFIIIVSLLMATNRYLLKTLDPLATPALKALSEKLGRDAENVELRQQVRELNWLARRAFFVRQWQLETGAILLVVAGVVFVLSLQLMASGRRPTPAPQPGGPGGPGRENPWRAAARARRVIAISGALLLLAAWGLHLRLGGRSRAPDSKQAAPQVAAKPNHPVPAGPSADAGEWPSFRGPGGLGVAREADPPIAWDGATGTGVLWKAEVPRGGFNSPVVWGDRVYLAGADEQKCEVYGYDAETGALLWTADTEGVLGEPTTLPSVSADTGYAAPSLAVDGRRVIAIFGTGVILGLDVDGRRLWARHLGTPVNPYGHASSLLILRDTVFVQFDHSGGSSVKALDVETGRDRWKQDRGTVTSWASPILTDAGGRLRLILSASPRVAAYDALTGAELWSKDVLSNEIGSSPAYANGRVFAANQYAKAVALDAATGEVIWSTEDLDLPDAGSPVATDRHLFMPTSGGTFSCIAATNGVRVWSHEFDAGGYGSPILAAGRIYWVTAEGKTRIFKAADAFELIAEPALGEASVCTPAAVGRRLYIRGVKHLFCIGLK